MLLIIFNYETIVVYLRIFRRSIIAQTKLAMVSKEMRFDYK